MERVELAGPRADDARQFVPIEIRALRSDDEYRACVALQRAVWGASFGEAVPVTVLKVGQRIGGLSAGAFDARGRLVGFVFGLTGLRAGRLVHWSHMLAVRAEHRDVGIGRRLKEFQRQYLSELGVGEAYWTFDPLVARNAHLNLSRLCAQVVEYVPDMYPDSDSELHAGLGTDRFVVMWRLAVAGRGAGVSDPAPEARRFDALPVVTLDAARGAADGGTDPPGDVRVEIPADIHEVRRVRPGEAARWRRATRSALGGRLARGARVVAFYRDAAGRCYYVLTDGATEASRT